MYLGTNAEVPVQEARKTAGRALCRLAVASLVVGAACERTVPGEPADGVARVVVTPETVRLDADDSLDFMAVAYTAAGEVAAVTVTWSASGGSVVDQGSDNGRHVGRFQAGRQCGDQQVIATARPGGRADTAMATVVCQPQVAVVAVLPAAPTIGVGGLISLTATARDAAGSALLGLPVNWSSAAPAVAVVNGAGVVVGVGTGTAAIHAEVGGVVGTAVVTVSAVPAAGAVLVGAADIAAPGNHEDSVDGRWDFADVRGSSGEAGTGDDGHDLGGWDVGIPNSSKRRGGSVAEHDSYTWAFVPVPGGTFRNVGGEPNGLVGCVPVDCLP